MDIRGEEVLNRGECTGVEQETLSVEGGVTVPELGEVVRVLGCSFGEVGGSKVRGPHWLAQETDTSSDLWGGARGSMGSDVGKSSHDMGIKGGGSQSCGEEFGFGEVELDAQGLAPGLKGSEEGDNISGGQGDSGVINVLKEEGKGA